MFKACVSETALTTAAANEYFENRISGENFKGDTTTVAAARAFLDRRMPDGAWLNIQFRSAALSEDWITNNPVESVIRRFTQLWDPHDECTFTFYNLSHPSKEANLAALAAIRNKLPAMYDGWTILPSITDYFRGSVKNHTVEVLCLINETIKSTVIFVDNLTFSKLHFIQGLMLATMPWYYKKENNDKTAEERAVISSCVSKDESVFLVAIAAIAQKYDFELGRLKRLLSQYQSSYERQRKDTAERALADIRCRLDNLDVQYRDYLRRQRDTQIELAGLEANIENADANPEILSLFLDNRDKLILERVSGDTMTFVVRDTIGIWDEDEAENIIENLNSGAYRRERNFTKQQARMLLRAVFIDQSIKLRVCAAFQFSLSGEVNAISHYNFGTACQGYMPNPHHQEYACIDGNRPEINRALRNRDYVGAIIQAMASAKGLNFGDTTVMGKFYDAIFTKGEHNRAFQLPDGSIVTSAGAIEWLEAQEGTGGESE